ncbi:tyrosine decarboxylase / aspartate 1-decarboxylase [Halogranum amylolyticum]|uniref:Probable L-aspartate decarboxylase n=1 Tax=Halogranum amylolyticum TaxID=660520 RepID=A0A1H8UAQ0_9EURY|nr:tyrosine decarboxylase MfnA [Halogranum amylolyticum]SEP00176.1 tyrosine decarboxylase / aspartate 1-decarboxylase [Halogranum amylolyticum]
MTTRTVTCEPQNFRRVLSSMCTEPHPLARQAASRFLATNPGDPTTYRTVSKLESEVVERLGEVTGQSDVEGYIASGGTEANIQAVRAARDFHDVNDPNVVVPEHAHFSFHKAADVLDVELRTVPLTERLVADVDAVAAATDRDTVLVAGVAGSTEYGRVDPIPKLADLAAAVDAFTHVDAAWGGFYLPFTEYDWNFADAAVDTLTIDPHKLGQAAVPAGGFLTQSRKIMDTLAVETPYLESTSQATLTGTRSGAGVASAVAVLRELWPDGYREQFETSMSDAEWLADALSNRGFDVVEPTLPLVAASVSERLFERLRKRGWRLSRTANGELRIVCMPHVTRELLESFVETIDELR